MDKLTDEQRKVFHETLDKLMDRAAAEYPGETGILELIVQETVAPDDYQLIENTVGAEIVELLDGTAQVELAWKGRKEWKVGWAGAPDVLKDNTHDEIDL